MQHPHPFTQQARTEARLGRKIQASLRPSRTFRSMAFWDHQIQEAKCFFNDTSITNLSWRTLVEQQRKSFHFTWERKPQMEEEQQQLQDNTTTQPTLPSPSPPKKTVSQLAHDCGVQVQIKKDDTRQDTIPGSKKKQQRRRKKRKRKSKHDSDSETDETWADPDSPNPKSNEDSDTDPIMFVIPQIPTAADTVAPDQPPQTPAKSSLADNSDDSESEENTDCTGEMAIIITKQQQQLLKANTLQSQSASSDPFESLQEEAPQTESPSFGPPQSNVPPTPPFS